MENQKLLKNLNSKGRLLALLLTLTAGLLYCSSAWAWTYPYFKSNFYWNVNEYNQTADGSAADGQKGYKDIYLKGNYDLYYYYSANSNDFGAHTSDLEWMPSSLGVTTSGYECTQSTQNKLKIKNSTFSSKADFIKYRIGYDGTGAKLTIYVTATAVADLTADVTGNTTVLPGGEVTLTMKASGGTGSWNSAYTATGGTLSKSSSTSATTTVKWTAPSTPGTYTITNTVTDATINKSNGVWTNANENYTASKSITITVLELKDPTVLIGAKESVSDENVTLNGYIKYTGCQNVTEYGFVYGTSSEVTISATKVVANPDPIGTVEAGTDFTKTFEVAESGTYYYKAYMITSGGNYLSAETRQFTVDIDCDIITTVNATFEDNKTESSATYVDVSASIGLKTTNHAKDFLWECITKPDDADVTFTPAASSRIATVGVTEIGDYTFRLKGKCETDEGEYVLSETLTLHVCAPAEFTQLYLDNHTDNVLCVGEKATATCQTREGYTYSLYSPSGDNLGSLAGTGATQTWRNVTGAGEFTMRTSPTSMPQCAAVVSAATQRYNEPLLEITAEPALSVLSYQPVTLSKKSGEGPAYADTDPTWVITNGSDKAYLLNEHNRLAYDNRARKSVVFKAGAGTATQITVQASAYKTVEVDDPDPKVENYTKQCPATTEVTLTVSPAVDDCD